jgi:hypothetical protein
MDAGAGEAKDEGEVQIDGVDAEISKKKRTILEKMAAVIFIDANLVIKKDGV